MNEKKPNRRRDPEPLRAMNNGFWDLQPQDRAAAMESACERNDCSNFFDLPPEERARAYGYESDDQ